MKATDRTEYLIRRGMPSRYSHEIVDNGEAHAIELRTQMEEISLEELKTFSSLIDTDVYDALSLEQTLTRKSQTGGTARASVKESLANARRELAESSPGK